MKQLCLMPALYVSMHFVWLAEYTAFMLGPCNRKAVSFSEIWNEYYVISVTLIIHPATMCPLVTKSIRFIHMILLHHESLWSLTVAGHKSITTVREEWRTATDSELRYRSPRILYHLWPGKVRGCAHQLFIAVKGNDELLRELCQAR